VPMDRSKYPDNWEEISHWVRFERAQGVCEGCGARHGEPHPITGSKVVLTTAHLDHNPQNNNPDNLRAWCQRCHLRYDARLHAKHAAKTRYLRRHRNAGQLPLIPEVFPAWVMGDT